MNSESLDAATNPDLVNSLTALRRAARMAREVAVRTDTEIVVIRDGKLVRITAEDLRCMGVR
jgi:hypothetical protein